MKERKDTFANRLNIAMKMRNIKSVELHEKTGISESLISKYLKGKAFARQNNIYILCKELDINEPWLMGYDVSMKRIPDELRNVDNDVVYKEYNEINTEGLTDEEIEEVKQFVEFMKNKKKK